MNRLYRNHFLLADFILAIVLTSVLAVAGHWIPILKLGIGNLADTNATLYSTLAGLDGTLLGFTITSISIVTAIGYIPQLKLLRDSGHMSTVWTVFAQAIGWLALATVWSLIGVVLSSKNGRPGVFVAVGELGLVIVSGLRIYRCVWALNRILHASVLPAPPGIDN